MKKVNGASASSLSRSVPRVVVAALAVAFGLFILAPTVGAVTNGFEIIIDVDTVKRGPEGSVIPLASEDVPEEFAGQPCVVTAESQNQGSVHPGNDLEVVSGGSQVLLPDVEAVPLGTVNGVGQLVLGDTIVVSLLMGPDKVFSAGIDVIIDCSPLETTTTIAETTTTVPEPTTTDPEVSPTSITSPPTTEPPPTSPSTTAEVLPTSITSAPSTTAEVLASDTLPFTGADSGTPALLALALIGVGALALVATRRAED